MSLAWVADYGSVLLVGGGLWLHRVVPLGTRVYCYGYTKSLSAFDVATTHGGSLIGGAKGKSNENHRDNKKGALMTDSVRQNQSVGGLKIEEKPKAKTKQKASATRLLSSSIQQQVPGNERDGDVWLPSSFNDSKDTFINSEEAIDFDSIAQNDNGAPDDLNDWFKDLPDGDFTGCLDIPMDDLSMVL